mmetsp:Transcript_37715/g.43075  ORF Transcript_37715/g.43075 Transcript_37715/m.43075 type:complete len:97 (+) Transcript_37715:81-371(+)
MERNSPQLLTSIEKPAHIHARTCSDLSVLSSDSNSSDISRQSNFSVDSNDKMNHHEKIPMCSLPMLVNDQVTSSKAHSKRRKARKTHRRSQYCFIG